MQRLSLTTLLLLLLAVPSAAAKTKLAVMPIVDGTRTINDQVADGLTDALRTQLAQTGRFVVIDKSRQAAALKGLIKQQKRDSYRACYKSSCQIPLGQALAADTILRTKIIRVGSSFIVNAELVDLAKEAVVGAAQAKAHVRPPSGRDDRLLAAIAQISKAIAGSQSQNVSGGGSDAARPEQSDPVVEPDKTPSTSQITDEERERLRQAEGERQARVAATQAEARRRLQAQRQAGRQGATTSGQPPSTPRAQLDALKKQRFTYLLYGWCAVAGGAAFTGLGVYYLTAKVNEQKDIAANASSSSVIDDASDKVKTLQTTGWLLIGAAAAAAAVGTYLIVRAPSLPPEANVAGVKLERVPRGSPTPGGFAMTWGGRF
jgi:TolB-like protein